MKLAGDDADGDLALALGERVRPAWKCAPNGPATFASFGLCTQILLGPGSPPRVSIMER